MLERFHYWLSGITERKILIIAAILIFLPMLKPGCSSSLEDMTIRAAVRFEGGAAEEEKIVIAAIDQRAFNTYGPWPGPAKAVTQAVDAIERMNPRLIVVDDRSDRGSFDLIFALPQLRGDAKAIIGYRFHEGISDLPQGYAEETEGKPPAEASQLALPSAPSDDYSLHSMAGIDLDAVKGSERRDVEDGFSNAFPDSDGVVRSQPLAVRLGHRAYPSLVLAAVAKAKGFTPIVIEDASGKPNYIALGDERMKVPPNARMDIAYRGAAGTIPTISIVDIVSGEVQREEISDKIVLVGFTDPNIAEMLATPFGRMPSVEVLGSTLAGLMEFRRAMTLSGILWSAAAMLLALTVYALGIVRLKLGMRLIWTVAIIVAAWAIALALYAFTGILLPAMQFTIFAAALLAVSAAWRIFVIEIPRRVRMRTFQMRVAPEDLEKAMKKPGAIIARGISRDIIALAFDIRGYAALTSTRGQEELCPFMREYRTILARVLIEHGAFIDSWAGDECRAAFGAIMPGEGFELAACRAAFDAVKTLARLREEINKRYGVDRVRLGIGIAHGRAAVGSLGPRGVSDIGITGEAMERAVTLRALNKTYRTSIIVDNAVREVAEHSFAFRPLDPILVPGTERIVHLHELLGKTGVILPLLEKYLEAREAYLRGEFETAAHLFAIILAEHPHDGPSLVLMKRARTLAKKAPKDDWKGIWGHS